MKRFVLLMLAVLMVFNLSACGGSGITAEETLVAALTAVQEWDNAKMSQYFTGSIVDTAGSGAALKTEEMQRMLFGGMTYNIISCEERGEVAVAIVEISNKNMQQAMESFITGMMDLVLEHGVQGGEELNDEYAALLKTSIDNTPETVTKTVTITMSSANKEWKVVASDELIDALSGGLLSYAQGLDDTPSQLASIRDWVRDVLLGRNFNDVIEYLKQGTNDSAAMDLLDQAMIEKTDYDTYMTGISEEYGDVLMAWQNLSSEIDVMYDQVLNGTVPDATLCQQYFDAFDASVNALSGI